MAEHCCGAQPKKALLDPRWRRALWIAMGVNGVMFVAEMGAGLASHSVALRADALDFLGDTATYAISLLVAGMVLRRRAQAAFLKGASLAAFGLWIIGSTAWSVLHGATPEAPVMGVVGFVALVANAAVALMLFKFRTGDANMRSVWICSRNDAIGNLAVLAAAGGVFGTGTRWPDLVVAAIMASVSLWSGFQIMRDALGELRTGIEAGDAPTHA